MASRIRWHVGHMASLRRYWSIPLHQIIALVARFSEQRPDRSCVVDSAEDSSRRYLVDRGFVARCCDVLAEG